MTEASAGLPWTNIIAGETDKARLWAVNTETQYHEEKDSRLNPAAGRTHISLWCPRMPK